jgi:hypothetical protein
MNNTANIIGELCENVFLGFPVPEKYLKDALVSDYFYLTPKDIKQGIIPTKVPKGVQEKDLRKEDFKYFNPRMNQIEYGDFLVYLENSTPYLVAYSNQLGAKVIFSDDIVVIRSANSYLKNFLQNKEGYEYVLDEIKREHITETSTLLEFIRDLHISEEYLSGKQKSEPLRKDIDISSIRILPRTTSLDNILKRLSKGEINIFTDFQRKASIWKEPKIKSRFIESMLIDLFPLPYFYFDATNDDKWLVIDGLQRLTVIKQFYEDGFVLENLEYLIELNGKSYNTLERRYQRSFEEREITMYIVYPGTPKEVKYSIFQRLNTSEPLNPQEIRYALNPGLPREYIDTLLNSRDFKNLISDKLDSTSKERRIDEEIVLQYLALRMFREGKINFSTDSAYFLDMTMIALYEFSELNFNAYKARFNESLRILKAIFGSEFQNVFFFKNPINHDTEFQVNLFQSWVICLSELSIKESKRINPQKTKESYNKRLKESKSISNFLPKTITSQSNFQTKIDIIKETLVYD